MAAVEHPQLHYQEGHDETYPVEGDALGIGDGIFAIKVGVAAIQQQAIEQEGRY